MSFMTFKTKALKGIQISKALNHDVNVYSRDTLPYTIHGGVNKLIVCNTAPAWHPGEHWIAIYINKSGVGEYFDSMGNHPLMYGFDRFMDTNSLKWFYNDKCIQSYDSNVCGYHVICYCLSKINHISLLDYTNAFFNNNPALNDDMVVCVVKKMKLLR